MKSFFKQFIKQVEKLTDVEKESVVDYINGDAYEINKVLRNQYSEHQQHRRNKFLKDIKNLKKVFNVFKTKNDIVAYRLNDISNSDYYNKEHEKFYNKIKKLKVNDFITLKGFTSCSLNKKQTLDSFNFSKLDKSKWIVFKIFIPKNTNIIPANSFESNWDNLNDDEIILNHNSKFKVIEKQIQKSGLINIILLLTRNSKQ
jgi:hypothetical protein